VIEPSFGLSGDVLAELADLEARVLAVDGGRLKLEWGTLRSRPADSANDVLARVAGRLVGFVGVYRHGAEPELTGMVDPAHRRQGLATRALAAVLPLVGGPSALLVVPRGSAGGRRLALTHGGVLDHAEHALVQRKAPTTVPAPDGLHVRPAVEDDRAAVGRLLEQGFGDSRGAGERLDGTVVAEVDGRFAACLAVDRGPDHAGVYGFVVDADLRGRGIGRAVLGRVCHDLRADGVDEVRLEVEVENERALGLYTSLGFDPVTTEDYYRLATVSDPADTLTA
jgi:ribosomal protein S18 acetylase RimI-like enzyme